VRHHFLRGRARRFALCVRFHSPDAKYTLSKHVSRGEAPVHFGSLLEWIRCCNGHPQPCGGHGAIEGRKLFVTGEGIVGDDVDIPPFFRLRLHSFGISDTSSTSGPPNLSIAAARIIFGTSGGASSLRCGAYAVSIIIVYPVSAGGQIAMHERHRHSPFPDS
jgi:hypothetical protein